MSEINKNEAGVAEEKEKTVPDPEAVTEPVEESPEATAGSEPETEETPAEDDKETKTRRLSLEKRKKTINWNSRWKILQTG